MRDDVEFFPLLVFCAAVAGVPFERSRWPGVLAKDNRCGDGPGVPIGDPDGLLLGVVCEGSVGAEKRLLVGGGLAHGVAGGGGGRLSPPVGI